MPATLIFRSSVTGEGIVQTTNYRAMKIVVVSITSRRRFDSGPRNKNWFLAVTTFLKFLAGAAVARLVPADFHHRATFLRSIHSRSCDCFVFQGYPGFFQEFLILAEDGTAITPLARLFDE